MTNMLSEPFLELLERRRVSRNLLGNAQIELRLRLADGGIVTDLFWGVHVTSEQIEHERQQCEWLYGSPVREVQITAAEVE